MRLNRQAGRDQVLRREGFVSHGREESGFFWRHGEAY